METCKPKIYVASLAHYNHGELVGSWFDCFGDLSCNVQQYIQSLTLHGEPCEEWAIHDYEGFGAYRVCEYENLTQLSLIAYLIKAYGLAITSFLDYYPLNASDFSELEPSFNEAYCGEWSSKLDFATNFFDDLYSHELDKLPNTISSYFDYDAFARDLFISDYFSLESQESSGIYVFRCI